MSDLWNNTCVLITSDGKIFLSNPQLKGHNMAISDCAKKVGLTIPIEQSMVSMLEILANDNHVVLLNCGRALNENEEEKRTGYLALPNFLTVTQMPVIENLKLLLEEEYLAITVWQIENQKLKTKSMGNVNFATILIQEMMDKANNQNLKNIQK